MTKDFSMQNFLKNPYNKIYVAVAALLVLYVLLLVKNIYSAYIALNALFVPLAAYQAIITIRNKETIDTSYFYPSSKYVFLVGLISSWIGNLLIGLSDKNFFLTGVVVFFVSHVVYIILMFNITQRKFVLNKFVAGVATITSFLIFLVLYFLWESMGEYRWYLLLYSFALLGLCIGAANTAFSENIRPDRAIMLMCGAFCFVISDTLIVTTAFLLEQTYTSRIFINITYVAAQILLIRGVTEKRLLNKHVHQWLTE